MVVFSFLERWCLKRSLARAVAENRVDTWVTTLTEQVCNDLGEFFTETNVPTRKAFVRENMERAFPLMNHAEVEKAV